MVDEIANVIVLIMIGVLCGVLIMVFIKLAPPEKTVERRKDESSIDYIRRTSVEKSEEGVRALQNRSALIALIAFYGLIAILIIMFYYIGLQMNWLVFLGSLFGGYLIGEMIFSLAKAGKIKVIKKKKLDFFTEEKAEY